MGTVTTGGNNISAIKHAGESLLTLINDILDLSKIEADKLEIKYTYLNIKKLLDEVEQIFAVQSADKNLSFMIDISQDLPDTLLLDEIRLRQVLFNIVGNAVKFTHKGYIKLSARVAVKKNDHIDMLISVEDTGVGIQEDELECVFDAFKQSLGQDSSTFGGTGLGLTISKRLVKMMNGQIRVKSKPNSGSVFSITLKDVEFSRDPVRSVRGYACDPVKFKSRKILVVDDATSTTDFLKALLGRSNLEVQTAENGKEAVAMSEQILPAVILMDIRMPVMDGFEAARIIKSNPVTRQIPIMAVTASNPSENFLKPFDSVFDAWLFKPVRTHELISHLKKYLPVEPFEFEKKKAPSSKSEWFDYTEDSLKSISDESDHDI